MAKFRPSFRSGELVREIALRGLTQKEFAAKAGLDSATILKASQGRELHPKSWGKIVIALGAIPPLEVPPGLVKTA